MRKKYLFLVFLVMVVAISCSNHSKLPRYKADPEFTNEQKVQILGYSGNAMEPFITKDDKYLFFNDLKNNGDKDLFYAVKLSDTVFKFMGEIKGVNTSYVDANPTMDEHNNFCFISTRNLKAGNNGTIFCGKFNSGTVTDLHQIKGTVNISTPFWINMGVELSKDGNTMYVSSAKFMIGASFPHKGDIRFAVKEGDEFNIPENESKILKNINTEEAIEYAGELSSDGLELFYSQVVLSDPPVFKLLHAKRKSVNDPFGYPLCITEPFKNNKYAVVEAPTLSADGRRLYYHKKDKDGIFKIFMVVRE